jgi:hypothetical protein
VRNKEITTVITAGISRSSQGTTSTYCALASLDGKMFMVLQKLMFNSGSSLHGEI